MPAKKKVKEVKPVQDASIDNDVFLTEEGLKALVDELTVLKTTRRKGVAEKIKAAIALGDLSENAEYEEAKNEQAFIEGRILELGLIIKNAKIFKEKKGKKGASVQIGNRVDLLNKITKELETYTIVGSIESDPLKNKISNESPVGSTILGSNLNDVLDIKTPGGKVSYTIKKIY